MDNIKQMEISYHREMKNNYLMIMAEEEQERGFETRMLIGNTIDGLLRFRIRKSDNRCQFCYEITSKQPLGRLLETKMIHAEQLRKLLLGIAQTLIRMEDYLLTEEQILLDPDFIYVDLESFQPGLCLFPGRKGNFPQEFSELLSFLLGKVDHQDKEAVVLIYGLYRESLKDNYGLDNLLRWLIKEEPSAGEPEPERKEEPGRKDVTVRKEALARKEAALRKEEPDNQAVSAAGTPERLAKKLPLKPLVCSVIIIPASFLFFLLQNGTKNVYSYVTSGILGGVILISMAGIAISLWRWRKIARSYRDFWQKEDREKLEEALEQTSADLSSWEMVFCEPKEEPEEAVTADRDTIQTALLWSRDSGEGQRRLIPESPMQEPIIPSYYPYLIGKQEQLVDHVLHEDTVSRLHVRIDRVDGEYRLTDLNSTNGTAVNGRMLEANETVTLNRGDRVEIARLVYYFQ